MYIILKKPSLVSDSACLIAANLLNSELSFIIEVAVEDINRHPFVIFSRLKVTSLK